MQKNPFKRDIKKPLFPVYLLGLIGDYNLAMISISAVLYATGLEASTVKVGWIGTAYGLSYCFMPAIMGFLTDKIPRRKSLLIATTLQVICSIFFVFATMQQDIDIFFPFMISILLGFGVAYSFYWPNVEAFISEYTEHNITNHERAISNFCVFWGLGSAFGYWTGGLLTESNFKIIAFISLILFILAFSIVYSVVPISSRDPNSNMLIIENDYIANNSSSISSDKEIKQDPEYKKNISQKPENVNILKKNINSKILIVILLANIIFAFLARMTGSYFPNYAKLSDGLNLEGIVIGNLTLIFGLLRIVYFYLGRFFSKTLLDLSYSTIISGIFIIFLYFFQDIWIITIAFCVLGFLNGKIYYIALNLLMKHEQEKKSSKAGLFEAMVGIGSSTSPILAGSLALVSLRFPFLIYSLFLTFIGGLQYWIIKKNTLND